MSALPACLVLPSLRRARASLWARFTQVTPVAVKIENQLGLPGDSALGPNGDFCQLFDADTGDAYGWATGDSGSVTCSVESVDRPAGKVNLTLVQAGEYGHARVRSSSYAYDAEGRPFHISFAPRIEAVSPAAGSVVGGTVSR